MKYLFAVILLLAQGEESSLLPEESSTSVSSPVSQSTSSGAPEGKSAAADSDSEDQAQAAAPDLQAAILQLAKEKNSLGLKYLRKGRFPDALAAFKSAYELTPDNDEIVNNYGYAHYLLGSIEDAAHYYREALEINPERIVAYLNLVDLMFKHYDDKPNVLREAMSLLEVARELRGNNHRVIIRQARIAAVMGNYEDAVRYYDEYLALRAPGPAMKLELGDFYRDMGEEAKALEWYKKVEDDTKRAVAKQRIWDIEVEQQKIDFGWHGQTISERARRLNERAVQLFKKKQYAEAEDAFELVLQIAPTYAEAMSDYGDLLYRTGEVERAETMYLRSLFIALDTGTYTRLARLYIGSGSATGDAALAVLFLRKALEQRPENNEIKLKLATALQRSGSPVEAHFYLTQYLAHAPPRSPGAHRALGMKKNIERLLPPAQLLKLKAFSGSDASNGMSEETIGKIKAALLNMKKGNLDMAMASLKGISEKERNTLVFNLQARILLGAGRPGDAIAPMKASLRLNDKQGNLHEQLGMVYVDLGHRRKGRLHLRRAEQLGSLGAAYILARMDAGNLERDVVALFSDLMRLPSLLRAQRRVDRIVGNPSLVVYQKEVKVLNRALKKRFEDFWLLLIVTVGLILLGMVLVVDRVWGGMSLQRMVKQLPESGIQIQRVLSAVRHEVLKHNTMMLTGLVESMENEETLGDKMEYFRMQMLGAGDGGVFARLKVYVAELEKIGHFHKRRLNLKRKDPAISSLLKGMRIVSRNSSGMAQYGKLSERKKQRLRRDLTKASQLLNVDGYEAVRSLLDKLRTLKVDPNLLETIYNRCKNEPSFTAVSFASLDVQLVDDASGSVHIAVPRAAFEDIVTNLVRNAIQSTILYNDNKAPVQIGISIEREVDMVTGIERMALGVKDTSGKDVTAEMLRGRYIEEGLGLTADLVTMYDGTLDIQPESAPYVKAVIVKLPMA